MPHTLAELLRKGDADPNYRTAHFKAMEPRRDGERAPSATIPAGFRHTRATTCGTVLRFATHVQQYGESSNWGPPSPYSGIRTIAESLSSKASAPIEEPVNPSDEALASAPVSHNSAESDAGVSEEETSLNQESGNGDCVGANAEPSAGEASSTQASEGSENIASESVATPDPEKASTTAMPTAMGTSAAAP